MKKIIGLILASLLIVGIVGSGTWAFLSDSEASQNNTLTAGILDLQVGAADPCTESISLGTQIVPGDSGNAADWTTTNLGSISGTATEDLEQISLTATGNLVTEGALTGFYEYEAGGVRYYRNALNNYYRGPALDPVADTAGLDLLPVAQSIEERTGNSEPSIQ